jgi:hypothetical protein
MAGQIQQKKNNFLASLPSYESKNIEHALLIINLFVTNPIKFVV